MFVDQVAERQDSLEASAMASARADASRTAGSYPIAISTRCSAIEPGRPAAPVHALERAGHKLRLS